jgi:predicted CXXCH cytochrome family protein
VGWLALLAAAPPFSHKPHLEKQIDCVVCHTAAASSKSASDNLIPAATVCAGCHTDERREYQPREPRKTTVTKFSHQIHVKLGPAIAATVARAIEAKTYLSDDPPPHFEVKKHPCTGCHRGLASAGTTSLANFPQMAECLVCHNQIDNPFSCEKCHTQSPEQLKPASHTTGFLDRHSNKSVEKVGCAVCHGRRFTCLGCH